MLEMGGSPLGSGNLDGRVQTLAGKKSSAQLRGRPNAILVLSGRHQWGISSEDCQPRRQFNGGFSTGVCHAAVYGRKGDYLFAGEEFDGAGLEVLVQSDDGILRKSKTISAVLFLFHSSRDVLFENLQGGAGFSSRDRALSTRTKLRQSLSVGSGETRPFSQPELGAGARAIPRLGLARATGGAVRSCPPAPSIWQPEAPALGAHEIVLANRA